MITIFIDPGKNSTKCLKLSSSYEFSKNFHFDSKVLEVKDFNAYEDSTWIGTYGVTIEGKNYIVGSTVKNYSFDSTKVNNHHKVCVLTGISNLVTEKDEEINLIVGMPSSEQINKNMVEKYKTMFGLGKHDIVINKERKTFNIKSILVYPEGMTAKARLIYGPKYDDYDTVHCIDIGGYNTNYRGYDEVGNILNVLSLDNAGINRLESEIKKKLYQELDRSKYNIESINIHKSLIEGVIGKVSDKDLQTYSSTKELLKFETESFIKNNILLPLSSQDISLETKGDLVIISGGGSIVLSSYLKEFLHNNIENIYFVEDAQWENIVSYAIKYFSDLNKKHEKSDLSPMMIEIIVSNLINRKYSK